MIPNTAGTGAAGGYKTLRISQGDTVFGFYMAPDDGFPVIIGSLGRTDVTKDNPQVLSGFTAEKKPGLTGRQEANEKDGPNRIITLNRPEAANALNEELSKEFYEVISDQDKEEYSEDDK